MAKLTSHAIALVLLPPPHIAAVVDTLRSANDKSWPRWSAHITLLFPFGTVESLSQVVETLRSALANPELQRFQIKLDKVARFATSDHETVYLSTSNPAPVEALWNTIIKTLKYEPKYDTFIPHMTLGQTARNADSIAFLTDKGNRLLERHDLSWPVDHVALLRKREDLGGVMEVFAQFPIGPNADFVPVDHTPFKTPSFHFDGSSWIPTCPSLHSHHTSLTIGTYNILHHPAFPFSSRFPAVLEALLASNADVICLQEVDDESLLLILQNELVHKRYTWCSRSDNGVMESERNVVMLATEEFGFEWVKVQLGGKHKACVVARFGLLNPQSGKSVVIAGVHLSAGRSAALASRRREEISTLLSYLHEHHTADEWIVVGDVNWPDAEDFPSLDILTDIWAETIGAGGATYDPTSNPLAAATTKEDRSPERYDRLFVKRNGQLVVRAEGLELFGIPEEGKEVGSDHWGLKAVVDLPDDEEPRPRDVQASFPTSTLRLLPTTVTDNHLRELCAEKQYFPTEAHEIVFQKAVDALRGFLVHGASHPPADEVLPAPPDRIPGVHLVLVPVGSFAMGYHMQNSDIDCVVIGNLNTQTFWRLMRWKIRTFGGEGGVRLRRFVKDALVQMMVLDVEGVKIDLQYCPAAKIVEHWNDFAQIPRDSPLFSLSASTLRTLNAHRDALALLRILPSLDAFRLAHRALRLFLYHKGVFGARFGYLGGFHLTVLLARICLQAPPEASAAQLVRMFCRVYAQWDWDSDAVTVPVPGVEIASYRRTNREPMVVLSVEKPRVNMTASASSNSVGILKRVFMIADRAFENGLSWREICSVGNNDLPFRQFVADHRAFVKVGVSYWGSSCMRGRALIGWLESRFVGLLVQLHANAPTIRAHIWPARFADESTADDQCLNGFYLIGLSAAPVSKADGGEAARKVNANVKNNIATTLRLFEGEIHANTRYYDPTEAFISVTHVTFSQLPLALILDNHRWSDGGFDEAEEEDTDSDDMADTVDDDEGRDFLTLSAAALKKKRAKSRPTSYLPGLKLRKSSDVYHRLIWDPAASKDDYVIGYEDRFVGIKEIPLGSWNREVEDETFIPFHRVVHFRRKSDNIIVWDRKTKIDLVFGSGIKPEHQ